jgi:hypothetical protein
MQREELSLREGKICSDLSREVENALALETRSFFSKMSQSNIRRWQLLSQKNQREKEELIELIRDKCRMHFSDNFTVGSQRPQQVTPIDLEIESLRLEMEYNKNWFDIESFHINEAFKSQKARIDSEWAIHFDNLNEAYDKKIRAVTGDDVTLQSNREASPSANSKWQHAEKQKTLIHTAPVFSPSMAVGSGVRAVRKKGKETSAAAKAEVGILLIVHLAATPIIIFFFFQFIIPPSLFPLLSICINSYTID